MLLALLVTPFHTSLITHYVPYDMYVPCTHAHVHAQIKVLSLTQEYIGKCQEQQQSSLLKLR